ncbi:MAG: ParB N-terminal domain-containing protein [Cohaesibacter sp.]|nr:ParB N-terminal domain-containing protein [Cohaesibacter sp.]
MARTKSTAKSRTPKPATGEQTKGSASAPVEIRQIPLSQLELSPKNVRKVPPSEAEDAQLLASIREQGLKQNLIVYSGPNDTFLVDAGWRRLKALKALAEEGGIPQNHPVVCLVEEEQTATLSSIMENVQRAAMHPADQFEAFATLIEEGRTEEEIAQKFGVDIGLVRRRLKLARVAPAVFEAFRAGDINLECVMAFTLSDNHDRQLVVWNSIKDNHHVHPNAIKRMLTETSYSAASKLGKFVGQEAYEAAGGTVMSDLFSERDTTYFENPELVERLALEKLQAAAENYIGKWKWVDAHIELDQGALRSFGRVSPQEVDLDPALIEEIETLNAREEELVAMGDGEDLSLELLEEYEAIQPRIDEIHEQIEAARPYSDADRAIAGVVLSIGWNGELALDIGLVRPEDIPEANQRHDTDDSRISSPTSSTPFPVSDPAGAMRKAEGMPNSLADDLRTTRHHILRAHLAVHYNVAFDAMLYTMCKRAFSSGYISGLPLDVSLNRRYVPNGEKLVASSIADRMLEAIKEGLTVSWMLLEQPKDFQAMSKLTREEKEALFAWAAATTLEAQLSSDNSPSAVIEELGARMDVDVAACWRPTAANYWGKVTKAHIGEVAKDLIGEEFATERNSEKKLDENTDMSVDTLLLRAERKAVILPLFLYDHSGLAMNTTGFHCPWDSGQVGFIYATLEEIRKEYDVKRVSAQLRAKVEDVLRNEVATYHEYLSGNIYGYVIEQEGEEIDACWGFLGDYDGYVLSQARSLVETRQLDKITEILFFV